MPTPSTATIPAIAVFPGTAGSVHLTELPDPTPGPGQALVGVRRVGVCGTDQEIIAAKFGTAPAGLTELVLGHEVLGVVEAVGPSVDAVRPGELVAATVRRPDGCPACLAGQPDFCVWRNYTERGLIGAHGFMVERFVDDARHLVSIPDALEPVGVLLEPLTVVEKAARQADLIQRRIASWAPTTALVLAAGPIGLLGTLLLRARGLDVVTSSSSTGSAPSALPRWRRCASTGGAASLRSTVGWDVGDRSGFGAALTPGPSPLRGRGERGCEARAGTSTDRANADSLSPAAHPPRRTAAS